jgi:1-deoxy-D-xylulose-5-phosphate synthase
VGLQKLPVIFALDRSGFVGEDGKTHQGLFDISLFRPAPDMTILSPAGAVELSLMLDWALTLAAGPVMIRYPKAVCPADVPAFALPLETGRGLWISRGARPGEKGRVCLAFTGGLYPEALDAAERLGTQGIIADLYHLRFLKPVDEDGLAGIMDQYELTVFVEEGIREGGFGEYAAALALRRNCAGTVRVLAVEDNFAAQGTRRELLEMNGLDGGGIAAGVFAFLAEKKNDLGASRLWVAEPK